MNIQERIEEAMNELEARIEELNEEIWLKEEALSDLTLNGSEEEINEATEEIEDLKWKLECLEDELRETPAAMTDYADYQHMVAVESRYW